MRAPLLALVLAGCASNGIDPSTDMAGATCVALGGACVDTSRGQTCDDGSIVIDVQESYCGAATTVCCLPPCPSVPADALGQPCVGARTCEYPTTCQTAVCQPVNGYYSWFVYTASCP